MADQQPDLHVVSLQYSLCHSDNFSYDGPPTLEFDQPEAHFCLADGVLTCEMKMHFSDAAAALKVIDPILRDWKLGWTCGTTVANCDSNSISLRLSIDRPIEVAQ